MDASSSVESRRRRYARNAVQLVDDKGGQPENDQVGVTADMGVMGAAFNLLAYSIALGTLSIPSVAASLGVVPFILVNLICAALTYYTGLIYWQLKLRYPGLISLEDAGELIGGRPGRIVVGACQLLFGIFLQGNHVLLGAIAFTRLGADNVCAVGLAAIFAVISFLFTLPRSYKLFSYFAFASFTSIIVTSIFAMIAAHIVGPINKPADAPPLSIKAFGSAAGGSLSFLDGMLGVTNILLSYGSHPAYIPIMSEMKDVNKFPKALAILVSVDLVLYTVVGGVILSALGQYTTSPSLSSLSPLLSKIAYGLALVVILVAGCASGQVTGRSLLVIVRRRLGRSAQRDSKARLWTIWVAVNIFTWTIGFILAEVIPFFSSFLSVESSLFWTLFIAFAAIIHVWIVGDDHRPDAATPSETEDDDGSTARKSIPLSESIWRPIHRGWRIPSMGFALFAFASSLFICVAGIIAAALSIRDEYRQGTVGRPFSCNVA